MPKRRPKNPLETEEVSSDVTFVSHLLKETEEYFVLDTGESSLKADNVKKQKVPKDKVRIDLFFVFHLIC